MMGVLTVEELLYDPFTIPVCYLALLIAFQLSMTNVDIFDVASMDTSDAKSTNPGTWYRQQATGDIPDVRANFCLVSATAPDNSSYNIYLYGGRDSSREFDQVYVVSPPPFQWMTVWEGDSPRWGHTCHVVGGGNSQMVTVGGVPNTAFTKGCDWGTKGVGVYDLSAGTWESAYDASAGEYQVPNMVYHKIGGSAQGNATAQSPLEGFASPGLAALFNDIPSNKISKGAMASAVIDFVAGAAIIAALIIFFIIRRRRANKQKQQQSLGVSDATACSGAEDRNSTHK